MKGRLFAYVISPLAILFALLLYAYPAAAQELKSKSLNSSPGIPEREIPVTAKGPGGKGGHVPIRSAAGSIAVNENPTYNSYSPAQLVQNVLITGCLSASNVTFQGVFDPNNVNRRQLGYFNKSTSNFPIDEGLILSSGYVTSAEGPNNSSGYTDQMPTNIPTRYDNDPDINKIAGNQPSYDVAALSFDFVPAGNTLEFQYIFSSEEYLEYTCSPFNDAFGFFLSGPGIAGPYSLGAENIALIPSTAIPVAINNVHPYVSSNYNHQSCAAQNESYYNILPISLTTQFDGMTVVLTATYAVQSCLTYHIKLAIGDVNDRQYNSAVFLKARSFNSEAVGATNVNVNVDIPDFSDVFEGCPANHFILERDPANISQPATVYILYGGTATNGADVVTFPGPPNPLPTVVNIPAGVSSYDISYIAVDDGFGDAGEKLNIQILQSCPCDPNPVYLTKTLTIYEQDLAVTATASNVSCGAGSSGSITANALHGSGNNLFSIDGGNTWQTSNLFTGLTPGNYQIYAQNVGSCSPATPTTVTVGGAAQIIADAGPDGTICNGESYQLQGSGGSFYTWTPETGLSDPEIPNPVASPIVTTTYSLVVTDETGACISTNPAQVTVTVNESPVIGITPLNRNICIGSSITLTASATPSLGSTFLWNLVPAETTQSITKTPLTSTSYTVIVTGANGCKVDSTANVAVHPLPTAVLSGDNTICSGALTTLTVTLTGTPNWTIKYTDGTTIFTKNNVLTSPYTFLVNPLVPTTYSLVSVTDHWGCSATSLTGTATVGITPLPTAPTTLGVDHTSFCPGFYPNITLTASGGSGTSINWYAASCPSAVIGTGSPITITPAPSATTTYYASNVNSCGISACTPITVNILPAPITPSGITANNSTSYCIGTTLPNSPYRLQADGITQYGYEWFKDAGCGGGAVLGTSQILTLAPPPSATTTYYVRSTNSNGCKSSNCALLTITVFPLSVGGNISTTDPTTVCSGINSGTFNLSGQTGKVVRWESSTNGGTSWSPIVNSTTSLPFLNLTTTTLYRAVVQSGSGTYICGPANSSTGTITVNPLPVPTITGPASACINSTSNTYATEGGMSNYTWSVSAGGIITAGDLTNTITVTWNSTGPQTVSINYTNANGCTAAASTIKNIIVNSLPVPTITGSVLACLNTTTNTYTTEASMSGYTWSVSAGGTITAGSSTNSITVTWSGTGAQTVSVNYTNANGCTAATATIFNVTVNSLPVPTITGPASACINSTTNSYSTGTGMSNYVWTVSAGGTITGGAGTNTITVTWNTSGAQTVSVNYQNANGCTGATPTVYNVTVNPLPVITISGPTSVCRNTPGNVFTTEAGMSNYIWTTGGGAITAGGTSTDNTITITWATTGPKTVTVNYTNANGCTAALPTTYNLTVVNTPVTPTSVTPNLSSTYCSNNPPVGTYRLTALPALIPGTVYEWFTGSCGGTLVATTPGNILTISAPLASTTYWVRASNACGVSGCASLTITVDAPSVGGSIAGSALVCSGTNTGILTLSGQTGNITGWESSINGGSTWVSIGNANNTSYTYNNLAQTTMYHAIVQSGSCVSATSATATITVGNIEVDATGGTPVAYYATLQAAFFAINTGVHQGIIKIKIICSTTETLRARLYNTGVNTDGTANYSSVTMFPVNPGLSISSSLSNATSELIDLYGADSVTIDGRVNQLGAADLTLIHTGTANESRNIRFINSAEKNRVRFCNIKGACISPTASMLFFSSVPGLLGNGNDNNIIEFCNITNSGIRPLNVISSYGESAAYDNSNNIISNNNIYDFFKSSSTSSGIYIYSNTSTWTITGNSFYETAPFTSSAAVAYYAIRIATGNGYTITGNYIGGRAPLCAGQAWTKTSNGNAFYGIYLDVLTANASSIQGNTIQNISWSNSAGAEWTGIHILAGAVNIGTVTGNTIGGATGTGSITVSNAGSTAANVTGIRYDGTGAGNIQKNTIGSITISSTSSSTSTFYGIYKNIGTGTLTISNNIIGSLTTNNSIIAGSSTASSLFLYGIYNAGTGNVTISGNTIANITNSYSGAGGGAVAGIRFNGGSGTNTVSKNFITSLVTTIPSMYGIYITAGTCSYSNNIINLGTNVTANCNIYGISENGSSTPKIYFNTVYIGGSVSSGAKETYALYSTGTTNARDFRNNIFYNTRSGSGNHYAIALGLNTSGLTIDYNDYFSLNSTATWRYNNLPVANFAAFQASTGQDVHSLNIDPLFATIPPSTPADFIPAAYLPGLLALGGINDDYDGTLRCVPTMGAEENAIDVGTPVFTAGPTNVCQDAPDATYTATATNTSGISYSVSPSPAAGTINPTTGVMNWNAAFSGTATITASAAGCNGPKTATFTVTVIATPAPTLSPASACSGTTPMFAAGNGSIFEFFVNGVSQGLPSTTATYTPTVPLAAGNNMVCVRSFATPFVFDGNLTEAAWGSPLATSAGGAVTQMPFTAGNNMDGIYIQSSKDFLYGGIAGNLVNNSNNRLFLFIDCQPGVGNNSLSTWINRTGTAPIGAPYYSMENLSSGITFDPGFEPEYILGINQAGTVPDVFYDLYNMLTNINNYLGSSNGSGLLGFVGNSNIADIQHGFEFAIPRSALGNPTGNIKIFAIIVNDPGVGVSTTLSNQFLTKANFGEGNYGNGSVIFGSAAPNPISVTLSNDGCSTDKCIDVNQTPTTSAIYHQ